MADHSRLLMRCERNSRRLYERQLFWTGALALIALVFVIAVLLWGANA